MSANVTDLAAARKYIEYCLKHGWKVGVGVVRLNGLNLNIDGMTDHYVLIYGVGRDEKTHRLYYEYADPVRQTRGRFYVDPNTQQMYVPVDGNYTVGGGGYQLSHIRAPADSNFSQEYLAATGQYPRDPYHAQSEVRRGPREPRRGRVRA
jgi:hypothetical protein